jgi:hypothetical protein
MYWYHPSRDYPFSTRVEEGNSKLGRSMLISLAPQVMVAKRKGIPSHVFDNGEKKETSEEGRDDQPG